MTADTIVALSSGGLPAGIAVLRLSGPRAGEIAGRLANGLPPPRVAAVRALRDGGELIDRGIVLWFPAPASFTGEDVAELQVHGGPAVVAAMLNAVTADGAARLAEPGEFTRRAFASGRLDLTAVEGLADLIAAQTEAQRRVALRQADGGLNRLARGWRERLLRAAALIGAAIDFADEDLPVGLEGHALDVVAEVGAEIVAVLEDGRGGELARDGVHVVLAGPPNVGKSSLLNRLARREVAIVSEIAGTTRDVIEVTLDLGGWPVVVADTAGLRNTTDSVEALGVARAEARRQQADIPVFVIDAESLSRGAPVPGPAVMVLANKVDLCPTELPEAVDGIPVFAVSALTGAGLEPWVAALTRAVGELAGTQGGSALITRGRHRAELSRAAAALARSAGAPTVDLRAEDVRVALHAIGRLTGAVDVEDLLGVIFAEFCIGK